MGRIAEALRKAQREREDQLRVCLDECAPAGTTDPGRLRRGDESTSNAADSGISDTTSTRVTSSPGSNRISRAYAGLASQESGILRGLRSHFGPRQSPAPSAVPEHWDVDPSLVCVHQRCSSLAEQYRAIRTWLLRRNTTGEHTSLAVTSSLPREGKTVTTANLAVSLAEVRHLNTLAVDCDFRGASLAKLFRTPNTPGLAEVLAGKITLAEALRATPLGNLSILPAGRLEKENPAVLLNSPLAAKVFDELRERFHYVLVDTPPVQKLTDAGVIGALCSGILFVVRMHKTPSHLARQSLHWLQSNNLSVIGCIAAACNVKDARHLYRGPYDQKG